MNRSELITQMNTNAEDLLSSMMLWNGSTRYLEAARKLFELETPSILPTPPGEPVYFLACQSIELALKGYLRGCGKDEDFLVKTCQHDLLVALKAADENGLANLLKLEPLELEVLDLANALFSSKALQFGIAGYYRYPHFKPLLQIAEKLVAQTEQFCLENVDRHTGKATAVQELRALSTRRRRQQQRS